MLDSEWEAQLQTLRLEDIDNETLLTINSLIQKSLLSIYPPGGWRSDGVSTVGPVEFRFVCNAAASFLKVISKINGKSAVLALPFLNSEVATSGYIELINSVIES